MPKRGIVARGICCFAAGTKQIPPDRPGSGMTRSGVVFCATCPPPNCSDSEQYRCSCVACPCSKNLQMLSLAGCIVYLPMLCAEGKCLDLKVCALYVDERTRESTLGASHEITERLFVVRRAFRVNDTLPGDTATASGWVWQRRGWLLVDRSTGHISAIALPEFDPYYLLLFCGQLVSRLRRLLRNFR